MSSRGIPSGIPRIVVSRPGSRYATIQASLVEAGPIESGLRESSKSLYFNVVPKTRDMPKPTKLTKLTKPASNFADYRKVTLTPKEKVIWRLVDHCVKSGESFESAKGKILPPESAKINSEGEVVIRPDPSTLNNVNLTKNLIDYYNICEWELMHTRLLQWDDIVPIPSDDADPVVGFHSASPSPNETIRYMAHYGISYGPGSQPFGTHAPPRDYDSDEHGYDPIYSAGELYMDKVRLRRPRPNRIKDEPWLSDKPAHVNKLMKPAKTVRRSKPKTDKSSIKPVNVTGMMAKIGFRGEYRRSRLLELQGLRTPQVHLSF